MTSYPHEIRFPEWITAYLLRIAYLLRTAYLLRGKRHYDSGELENLSDRSLEDIGLEVHKRGFGTLKPFWIP
jgi:uncharacterized protein YjiS (DUF1127 family)